MQDGVYNKSGVRLIPGPVTIYSKAKMHTGYLRFGTSGGYVLLDGDRGQRSISFSAGSAPSVSANTATKTVLAQSGSTAMKNFAFDMEE